MWRDFRAKERSRVNDTDLVCHLAQQSVLKDRGYMKETRVCFKPGQPWSQDVRFFIGDKPGLHTGNGRDYAGIVEVAKFSLAVLKVFT